MTSRHAPLLACLLGLAASCSALDPEGDELLDEAPPSSPEPAPGPSLQPESSVAPPGAFLEELADDASASADDASAPISIAATAVLMSSSGVVSPLLTIDRNFLSGSMVDSAVGNCPLNNNGPFIKLNAGTCLGPSTTHFYGWEMTSFQLENSGNVDTVDIQFTHGRTGLTAGSPQTLVYYSWNGQQFTYAGAFAATSPSAARTIRVTPPTRPAPTLTVVFGKSSATAAPPAGPGLRWYEVGAVANYVAAPTNLVARAVSPSQIDLTWTDTSNAETDFEIHMQDAAGWRSLGADPGGANQTSEPITGLAGGTTYSFRVRARSALSTSPFSNVATATTAAAPPGQIAVVNNTQIELLTYALDGVVRAPDQIIGNRAIFNVSPGNHTIAAAIGFRPSPTSAVRVCDWFAPATVISNQTVTGTVPLLTAAQVLTHCGIPADYVQGSYVDLNGFHTVQARINVNDTFDWWHDNVQQARLTMSTISSNPAALSFSIAGDTISMGWPFGSLRLFVNGNPVQMLRDVGW